jgi:hypothetical protein
MQSVANEPVMPSVIMLSVIMLSIAMISVVMLSVAMISVVMLSVVMLSVAMISVVMLNVVEPQDLVFISTINKVIKSGYNKFKKVLRLLKLHGSYLQDFTFVVTHKWAQ